LDLGSDAGRHQALSQLFGAAKSLAPDELMGLARCAAALKDRGPDEMVVYMERPEGGGDADMILPVDRDSSTTWRGRPNVVRVSGSVVLKGRLSAPIFVERDRDGAERNVLVLQPGVSSGEFVVELARTAPDVRGSFSEPDRDEMMGSVDLELERRNTERARGLREAVLRESISLTEAARLIGRTEQTAINRAKAGDLLAFRDGVRWMFPSWQFDSSESSGVVRGVVEVRRALDVPAYSAVMWFRKLNKALENRRPIDALKAREIERVIAVARSVGQQ
jgi:hypothetical protein